MTNEKILSFRRRFVKDFNLPINIVDSPYFEYYMDRYDFFPSDDYFACCDIINKQFNGSINEWLEHYAQVRDNIITTIEKGYLSWIKPICRKLRSGSARSWTSLPTSG